jgi:hypothetical protein
MHPLSRKYPHIILVDMLAHLAVFSYLYLFYKIDENIKIIHTVGYHVMVIHMCILCNVYLGKHVSPQAFIIL